MDFQVLIAESAIADLKEIVEFIARDNPETARRLGEKILAYALSLRTMPLRFPFHDRTRGIRKMSLQPFQIYYVCDQATAVVHVLHIWHGARRSPQFGGP